MSRVHDILKLSQNRATLKWYLKTHDGTKYGPVDLTVLCEWASQSRITPGNLISDNAEDWFPAQELPELKMEWQVSLPNGQDYGPFNVLAVPHLVQNGILPSDSRLTNMHSGKTIQVKELLKPTITAPREQPERSNLYPSGPQPAEQQQLESSKPLLHEAEVQRTIDIMTAYKSAQPVETRTSDQTYFKEIAPKDISDSESIAKANKLKDGISKLNKEVEQSSARAELAERDLAAQKIDKENIKKQSAAREDLLRKKLEQVEKDLKLAREEVLSTRQRINEGSDSNRLAIKREQDLTRALEETRKKGEADSALLFKVKTQLEELKNQKAEIQNRATQEENKLKSGILDLEKQTNSQATELQNTKSHFHALESELQAKQERLQSLASQSREKADAATAEIEKLKKEIEVQRSVNVDIEKSSAEKEAVLIREARTAKSAMANAENELAALRKQYENFRVQSSHKDSDLQHRIDQLNTEARTWSASVDQLKKELAAQQEECRRIEKRTKNMDSDAEKAQASIRQLQEQLSVSDVKSKRQTEEISRIRADLDNERRSLTEYRTRHLDEKNVLLGRIEQLQAENKNILTRLHDNEKLLALRVQELETIRAGNSPKDNSRIERERQLGNEIEAVRNELSSEKQQHLEEHNQLESLLKQANENEQNARRLVEELATGTALKASQLKKNADELSAAMARMAQLEEKYTNNERSLKEQLDQKEQKIAQLEKALAETNNELRQQNELHASSLADECKRNMAAQDRVTILEKKLEEAMASAASTQSAPTEAPVSRMQTESTQLSVSDNFLTHYSMPVVITAAILILVAFPTATYYAGKRGAASKLAAASRTAAISKTTSYQTTKPLEQKAVKPKPALPRISADRVKVNYSEKSCTVIFDFIFFSFMTNLTSDAMASLEAISPQIRTSLNNYKLVIEGHTDTVKMSSAATVSDNYALGLARAIKVLDILKNRFNFPDDSMEITSSGEQDPPFPNTDDALRKKNRTVVLKIVPK